MRKELEAKKWREAKEKMRIEVQLSGIKFDGVKLMRSISEKTNMDDDDREVLESILEEERKRLRKKEEKNIIEKEALKILEDARKKAEEEEKEKEAEEERQRREQVQAEVQRLQSIQTKAQQEEHESEQELKRCRLAGAVHQRMWEQEKEARIVKEKEEADAIERLKKEIEEREKR